MSEEQHSPSFEGDIFSDIDILSSDQFGFSGEDQSIIEEQSDALDYFENGRAVSFNLAGRIRSLLRFETFSRDFQPHVQKVVSLLSDGLAFSRLAGEASSEEMEAYLSSLLQENTEDDTGIFGVLPDGINFESTNAVKNIFRSFPEECRRIISVFREVLADWFLSASEEDQETGIEPDDRPYLPFPVRSRLVSSEGFQRNQAVLKHSRSVMEDEREDILHEIQANIRRCFSTLYYDATMASSSFRQKDKGKRHVLSGPSGIGKTQAFLEHLVADPVSYMKHTRMRGRPGAEYEVNAPFVILMRTHAEMDRAIATMKALRLDPVERDETLIGELLECGWLPKDYHNIEGALGEARDMMRRCRQTMWNLGQDVPRGPLPELKTLKWMSRSKGGCLYSETVKIISEAGLSPSRLCKTFDEDERPIYCEHYRSCPWIALQERLSSAQVVFLPTSYLKGDGLPEALKRPFMMVIDGDSIDCRISTEIIETESLALRAAAGVTEEPDDEEQLARVIADRARLWVLENIMGFARRSRESGIFTKGKRSLRDPAWGFAYSLALASKSPLFRQKQIDETSWHPFRNGLLSPLPEGVEGISNAIRMTLDYLPREIRPEMGIAPNMGYEDALLLARQSTAPQISREMMLVRAVFDRMQLLHNEADDAVMALLEGKEQPFYDETKSVKCGEWDHRIQWVENRTVVRGGGISKTVSGIRFSSRSEDRWENETILLIGSFRLAERERVSLMQGWKMAKENAGDDPKKGQRNALQRLVDQKKREKLAEGQFVRRPIVLAGQSGTISHEDILYRLWGKKITIHDIVAGVDVGRLCRVRTILFPEMEYRRGDMEGYAYNLFSRQARSAALVVRMQKFLGFIAAIHGEGRVMMASRKGAMEALFHNCPLPVNMDASYYGNLQNISLKDSPDALVTIGAFEAHIDTIDGTVGALTFDMPEPEMPLDVTGTGRDEDGRMSSSPHVVSYYRMRNEGGHMMNACRSYPGPWAEAISRSLKESEISRAFGRLSPFHRQNMAFFYAVGRVLPPDTIVDEAFSLEDILPVENMPEWNARYRWTDHDFLGRGHYETYWSQSAHLPNTVSQRFGEGFNPSGLTPLSRWNETAGTEPVDQDSLVEIMGHEMAERQAAVAFLSHAVIEQGGILFPWALSVSPSIQVPVALRAERTILSILSGYGFTAPFLDETARMVLPVFPSEAPLYSHMDRGWIGGLFFASGTARPHPFWFMASEFGEPDYLDELGFGRLALQLRLAYFYAFGEMPEGGGIILHVNLKDVWIGFDEIPETLVERIARLPAMVPSPEREKSLERRQHIAEGMEQLSRMIVHCRDGQVETPLISQNCFVKDFEIRNVLSMGQDEMASHEKRHLVPIRQRGVEAFGRGIWMAGQIQASIAKARADAGLPNYGSPELKETERKRMDQDIVAMSHSRIPYEVMAAWFALQEGYGDDALTISRLLQRAERRESSLPKKIVEATLRECRQRIIRKDMPEIFGIFAHNSPLLSNYDLAAELGFGENVRIGEDI